MISYTIIFSFYTEVTGAAVIPKHGSMACSPRRQICIILKTIAITAEVIRQVQRQFHRRRCMILAVLGLKVPHVKVYSCIKHSIRTAVRVRLSNIRTRVAADVKYARGQHQGEHHGKAHQQHPKLRDSGKSPYLPVTALSHNPTSQKQLPFCFQNFLHIHIYARVHGIFMHYDFNTAPPPLSTP